MSVTHIMATRDTSLIPKRRAERKVTVLHEISPHKISSISKYRMRDHRLFGYSRRFREPEPAAGALGVTFGFSIIVHSYTAAASTEAP